MYVDSIPKVSLDDRLVEAIKALSMGKIGSFHGQRLYKAMTFYFFRKALAGQQIPEQDADEIIKAAEAQLAAVLAAFEKLYGPEFTVGQYQVKKISKPE